MNPTGGPAPARRFQLDLALHATQKVVDADPRRFVVARCGRKWGKSTLAMKKTLAWAGPPNAMVWYVGPTYTQTKDIIWRALKRLIPREALYKKPNESELTFELKNSSIIKIMGADNPDSLLGVAPTAVVLEEAASMRPNVWEEAIFPNLAPHRAPAFFIGNPKGLNWYYDLWQSHVGDPDWGLHHYTIYDNPYIHRDEIALHRRNCKNEAVWRQEYLAEFESDAGRVFSFEESKICRTVPEPEKNRVCYRGIDWGQRDDTACLWAYLSGGRVMIFREYAQANLAASHQAAIIKNKTGDVRVDLTVISHDAFRQDPELRGITVALHFVRAGITPLITSSRNKAAARDMIQKLLSDEKILIDNEKCPMLIRQLKKLEWQDTVLEKPEDGDDDLVDALHYLVFALASRLLISADTPKAFVKDPNKLYLPDRKESSLARFTHLGDVTN